MSSHGRSNMQQQAAQRRSDGTVEGTPQRSDTTRAISGSPPRQHISQSHRRRDSAQSQFGDDARRSATMNIGTHPTLLGRDPDESPPEIDLEDEEEGEGEGNRPQRHRHTSVPNNRPHNNIRPAFVGTNGPRGTASRTEGSNMYTQTSRVPMFSQPHPSSDLNSASMGPRVAERQIQPQIRRQIEQRTQLRSDRDRRPSQSSSSSSGSTEVGEAARYHNHRSWPRERS